MLKDKNAKQVPVKEKNLLAQNSVFANTMETS